MDRYAWHLLLFVSIDLPVIDPRWQGLIHPLSPVEPEEGCVGEHTPTLHGDSTRCNRGGFRLDENSRYKLPAFDWG